MGQKRVVIRCTPLVLEEMLAIPEAHVDDPAVVEARESLAHALLSNLSRPQREAIELRMAGYAYSEAAEALGISIRSVRVREERGMRKLREIVEQNPDEYFLP